jgi:eukaryotic-like serine/threonine-protein kinase
VLPAQHRLSKYELLEEIGHGGMATVYRARDTRLERDVALKLLHRHLRESEEVEARFASEARAVAKLRHPNIVEVFDVSDEDEEDRYLVVELIRGCTLRDVLKRRKLLQPELGAEIVLELAAALEHAHGQGVIHRDIKPENVLIEMLVEGARASSDDLDRPRVKLTDFGIAKLLDSQGITSTGQVLGSPAHMAPEQIEGKSVDVRADIFSLGVLFYETLVGSLPFPGRNPAQVLRNVLDGNFVAPEVANPQIGARWSAIIVKALQREPAARYQAITEFATAIRAELVRLGFESARRDIGAYLTDPEGYTAAFVDRLVPLLQRCAEQARSRGEVAMATAQFNRALAYRPRDPQLLSAISRLRRRAWLARAAIALGGVALLSIAAWFGVGYWKTWSLRAKAVAPASTNGTLAAANGPEVKQAVSPAQKRADPGVVVSNIPPQPEERKVRRVAITRPVPTPSAEVLPVETRQVSVRLTGAVGGSVRIDGRERPWFGITHTLDVGEHVFEFVPPDETCCTPTRRVVNITAGDTVEVVVGHIPFKNAAVAVDAEASVGWTLSCPTLFSGQLELPGRRSVALNQVKVSGSCTVSRAQEGFTASRRVVTLRAGQTTVVPWP